MMGGDFGSRAGAELMKGSLGIVLLMIALAFVGGIVVAKLYM